jgi:hypothetical protein
MKNCLVMGFGRSGTSLMGGILHQAGYFLGEGLYPPRHSNPKGFFECAFINGINERILQPYDYNLRNILSPVPGIFYSPFIPGEGHRWLTYIQKEIRVKSSDSLIHGDISKAVEVKNFAYKDPRFNYTLDVWMPYLKEDTVFICMFRNPADTVASVIRECASAEYLSSFTIDNQLAEQLWINSYNHLLRKVTSTFSKQFIFIHYQQLLSGSILEKLSDKLQAKIDGQFIEKSLNRTQTMYKVCHETRVLYEKLCTLAEYENGED